MRRPRGKNKGHSLLFMGHCSSLQGILENYMWGDSVPLMESTTGKIQKFICQTKAPKVEHIGICKWRLQIAGVLSEPVIWTGVWRPYRQDKINHFLWQIVFRTLLTKRYVYLHHMAEDNLPGDCIRRDDPRTWCQRRHTDAHEDILHMLWGCEESQKV